MFGNGYDQGWYRYFHYSIRHNIDIRCWIFIFKSGFICFVVQPLSRTTTSNISFVYTSGKQASLPGAFPHSIHYCAIKIPLRYLETVNCFSPTNSEFRTFVQTTHNENVSTNSSEGSNHNNKKQIAYY